MMLCLELADQNAWKKVVFPALGTGQLKYPRPIVAKLMYDCAESYAKKYPTSHVKEVKIVLFPGDKETIKVYRYTG